MEHLPVASISVKVMAPARPMTRSAAARHSRHVVYVLEHANLRIFFFLYTRCVHFVEEFFIVLAVAVDVLIFLLFSAFTEHVCRGFIERRCAEAAAERQHKRAIVKIQRLAAASRSACKTETRTGLPVKTQLSLRSRYFFASSTASMTHSACFASALVVMPG